MGLSRLTAIVVIGLAASANAEDAAPSILQKKLIGHWIAEKDSKLHTYFSPKHRLLDRDIANSDAALTMMDVQRSAAKNR